MKKTILYTCSPELGQHDAVATAGQAQQAERAAELLQSLPGVLALCGLTQLTPFLETIVVCSTVVWWIEHAPKHLFVQVESSMSRLHCMPGASSRLLGPPIIRTAHGQFSRCRISFVGLQLDK